MIKITDITKDAIEQLDGLNDESYDSWCMNLIETFPGLYTVELHPGVDVHLYFDHVTFTRYTMAVSISRNQFATLIWV